MSDNARYVVKKILDHILDINAGKCSITEQEIIDEPDLHLQEALTGLLYLHEDLEFRELKRLQMEHEREEALKKETANAKDLRRALESLSERERKVSLQQERFRALNRLIISIMNDTDM